MFILNIALIKHYTHDKEKIEKIKKIKMNDIFERRYFIHKNKHYYTPDKINIYNENDELKGKIDYVSNTVYIR